VRCHATWVYAFFKCTAAKMQISVHFPNYWCENGPRSFVFNAAFQFKSHWLNTLQQISMKFTFWTSLVQFLIVLQQLGTKSIYAAQVCLHQLAEISVERFSGFFCANKYLHPQLTVRLPHIRQRHPKPTWRDDRWARNQIQGSLRGRSRGGARQLELHEKR